MVQLSRETRWRLAKQAFATHRRLRLRHRRHAGRNCRGPCPPKRRLRSGRGAPAAIRCASTSPWRSPCVMARIPTSAPHSTADGSGLGVAGATQLQGKELSFNNLVDLDACWELAQEFAEPAVDHRQAHQSLRRGHRRNDSRGLPEGACLRSGFCLRRRHRHQPRGRRRGRRRDRQAVCRSDRRAGFHAPKPASALLPRRICAWSRSSPRRRGRSSSMSPADCCCRTPTRPA